MAVRPPRDAMFLMRRPSTSEIDRFLDRCRDLPLSYGPIGIVRQPRDAGRLGEHIAVIGHGQSDFDRGRAALMSWKHFDIGWVQLLPRHAPVEPGTIVALLIRHFGFWSLNGARVLYRVGGTDGQAAFGFAYGTLTDHAVSGEELFEVFIDAKSGEVMYRIRAVARLQSALTRIGVPIVRRLQARFRRDSAAAMRRAVIADS